MKETGKDKIQKICDQIRKETLDPVKQEAREIIENAHLQAAEIIREAQEKADQLKVKVDFEIDEKQRLFQSSMALSSRQGIEMLKQKIENELFSKELSDLLLKEMVDPKLIAHLIESFVTSLEKQGIEEDFEAIIPKEISPRSINTLLGKNILERLKSQGVKVGDFRGGVQIRMKDRQITIDITESVVRELVGQYIRRDFRDLIFQV